MEIVFPKPNAESENSVRKTVYGVNGLVIQEIDSLGNTTSFEYDGALVHDLF